MNAKVGRKGMRMKRRSDVNLFIRNWTMQ